LAIACCMTNRKLALATIMILMSYPVINFSRIATTIDT
jgi:hypothetical protein